MFTTLNWTGGRARMYVGLFKVTPKYICVHCGIAKTTVLDNICGRMTGLCRQCQDDPQVTIKPGP